MLDVLLEVPHVEILLLRPFLIYCHLFLLLGQGGKGHALLLLRPEELGFLRYLKQAKVPLNEFEFSWSKIADIQPQVRKNYIQLQLCFFNFNNFFTLHSAGKIGFQELLPPYVGKRSLQSLHSCL